MCHLASVRTQPVRLPAILAAEVTGGAELVDSITGILQQTRYTHTFLGIKSFALQTLWI